MNKTFLALTFFISFSTLANENTQFQFIGCRPSEGECVYSCPTRSVLTERDPNVCHPEGIEPVACYCLLE